MLSALVLLSSMSFTFGMHFCMGQLESIALFSGVEPCEMATQNHLVPRISMIRIVNTSK